MKVHSFHCTKLQKKDIETKIVDGKNPLQLAQDQDKVLNELIQISEHLVDLAREKDAVIVLPGRSMTASKEVIKNKHPDINVICMPLSDPHKFLNERWLQATVRDEKERKIVKANLKKYLNRYLQSHKDSNMIVADFFLTGCGVQSTCELIANHFDNADKITLVGVHFYGINELKNPWEKIDGILEKRNVKNIFERVAIVHDSKECCSLIKTSYFDRVFSAMAPYTKYGIDNFGGSTILSSFLTKQGTKAIELIGEEAVLLDLENGPTKANIWSFYRESEMNN